MIRELSRSGSACSVIIFLLSRRMGRGYPRVHTSGTVGLEGKFSEVRLTGSSTLNRGQAARSASSSHRGFLPRHLGSSAGGTGYLNNSSTDQRCSVSPAAIAGVRPSPREQCLHTRL